MPEQHDEHRRQFSSILPSLERAFSDLRDPPEDILGHLADRGIHRHDLMTFADEVRQNWPKVHTIQCGIRDYLYFIIRITDYSKSAAREHWKLADWFQNTFSDSKDFAFYFLSAPGPDEQTRAVQIYPDLPPRPTEPDTPPDGVPLG